MTRISSLILIFSLFIASAALAAPVIEEAAEIWQQDLEPPAELIAVSSKVTPKVTVEYATSSFKKDLFTDSALVSSVEKVSPRIIIDYATSGFKRPLVATTLPGRMGDVDCSGRRDLADAIILLQILTGMHQLNEVCATAGLDGRSINMETVLYILEKISD